MVASRAMASARPPREVLGVVGPWLFVAATLLPFTWLFPPFDLTAPLARVALWLSDSGKLGMPIVCTLAVVLVVSRPALTGRARAQEFAAMALALVLFLGAGAFVNEYVVKPRLNSPRPNIEELAQLGLLDLSPERFYALQGERSAYLRRVLEAVPDRLPMAAAIRNHWIEETGFSFPSGHSTAAMLVATFFACVAVSVVEGRRRWFLLALLPWAVLICFARPVLRVHRPIDVTVGGLQGIALGLLSYLFVHFVLARSRRGTGTPAAS